VKLWQRARSTSGSDPKARVAALMFRNENFFELFERNLVAESLSPCIEAADGTVHSREWLGVRSARFANALTDAGCAPGDRVAVQVERSPHALALYLACVRGGFVFVPANTAYPPAELAYMITDAKPRVLVSGVESSIAIDLVAPRIERPLHFTLDQHGEGTLQDLARLAGDEFTTVTPRDDKTAAVLYTSGTTGRPKGAMLSHRAMSYCATVLGEQWRVDSTDVLLHALPLFHGHGLFVSSNVALAAGAKLVFHPRFDVGAVIEALPSATVFMGVPTYYHRMLGDERLTVSICSNMRLFTSGSAPLSAAVHRAFTARTGHEIVERYGTTETMILCSNPIDGERRPGSVGRALPGVEVRIAGTDDRPLPTGSVGMIQARSPGLFNGYWNLPDATRGAFSVDGFFRTGDLGHVSADGYVSITGRETDVIISGGYNVYAAEVEAAIDELEVVRESAVVAVRHPDFGEAVTAFIVPTDSVAATTSAEIVRWCKSRLASYKVPKAVHIVGELPRNAMGKVIKAKLREIAENASASDTSGPSFENDAFEGGM
jgi:malonyl-CoA/methylmalonyl-CoA synthetase